MKNSRIEWTDHTFNPWVGCTKVSPACDHCYAKAYDHDVRAVEDIGRALRSVIESRRPRASKVDS